jgi:hypothetical protein
VHLEDEAVSVKTTKATGGKKRSREEAVVSAAGTSPPVSPPRPDSNCEWKKSKERMEDLLALLNSGFLREKEVDMWRAAAGDPYPMEKNPDEILMFARFAERGLSLPVGDNPRGPLKQRGNPHLKPTTKPKHSVPNHAGYGPCRRDPDGPPRRPS